MRKLIKYIGIIWEVIVGNVLKLKTVYDLRLRRRMMLSEAVAPKVIVSLTSYGSRVSGGSLAYTIHSLLNQRVRAERVILWLSRDEFSDATLPSYLHFFKRYGLEVRYCEEMRSYKKLLPTLRLAPDYDVITADDDLYYPRDHVATLCRAHNQYPGCIVSVASRQPKADQDGHLLPYSTWQFCPPMGEGETRRYVLPLGGWGAYYPAGIMGEDVLDIELARRLCPLADDIWFFIMGVLRGVDKHVIDKHTIEAYPTDLIRQLLSKDRLFAQNVGRNMNDEQINNLINHFHLDVADWQL